MTWRRHYYPQASISLPQASTMAPIHQGGQHEIDNAAMPHSLTVGISKQGVSALPPNASTLSAPLDQGLEAISSKMSSMGHVEASKVLPSSTAPSSSPPTNTWSGGTQPVTITAQPSSKHPYTITASGTTVISTIASISATIPCAEAENNRPPLPALLNPNGLRVVEICVGVLGVVIIILLLLVLMRGQIWKWIRKAKMPISISKEPSIDMMPYNFPKPPPTLPKEHKRYASNSSCNTNSRAEQLQHDVPPVIFVPTSEDQDRKRASLPVRALGPFYPRRSSLETVYLPTPSPRPPTYSEYNNA